MFGTGSLLALFNDEGHSLTDDKVDTPAVALVNETVVSSRAANEAKAFLGIPSLSPSSFSTILILLAARG